MSRWWESLKPGDTVVTGCARNYQIGTVVKINKVKISVRVGTHETDYSVRFGRRMHAGPWESDWLFEATPTLLESIRTERERASLLRQVNAIRWQEQGTDVLKAVLKAVVGE